MLLSHFGLFSILKYSGKKFVLHMFKFSRRHTHPISIFLLKTTIASPYIINIALISFQDAVHH